jgi:stage II sporulation protein P
VATAGAEGLTEILDPFEHRSGRVFTMEDEEGRVILRTARQITVGDEYITTENNYYRVISVVDQTSVAQLIEKLVWTDPPAAMDESWLARVDRLLRNAIPVQKTENKRNKKIAVYNSHGAESYIAGDGTESKDPGGGILNVGDSLASALEEKGVEVIRSREPHTPHDAGAYQRSRRTAEEALKQGPDALIDVHRDAVPEEEYLAEVEGKERVQIQLVVGRQNQNLASNREFAEGLKKVADERYPHLIKGIFMARGNYNQDMSPMATLIEVGSHTNNKEQAEETAELFAEVVTVYLYGTAEGEELAGGATTPGGPGGTALRAVLWVILGLIVAVGIYLLISTGGIGEMKAKLQQFKNREFGDILRGNRLNSGPREETDTDDQDRPPEGS